VELYIYSPSKNSRRRSQLKEKKHRDKFTFTFTFIHFVGDSSSYKEMVKLPRHKAVAVA
jgi:hypothetical protein